MTTTSNIARWVTDRAATDPGLPAIKQGDTVLSYGDLDAASARFATVLADHGVRAGDRVAMIMPNVAYFPVVYYAILRLGAIVVPMNPLLKAGEISYTWTDSGAEGCRGLPAVRRGGGQGGRRHRHRRDRHHARASWRRSWPAPSRTGAWPSGRPTTPR